MRDKAIGIVQITFILIVVSILTNYDKSVLSQPNEVEFTDLIGEYLGQKPPGMTPEIFAPRIFSMKLHRGKGFLIFPTGAMDIDILTR